MVCNQFLILTRAGFSTPSIASITDAVIASHDVLALRIRVTCVGLQITLIDVYKVKVSHFKYELKNQVSHLHVVLSVVLVKIWCGFFFLSYQLLNINICILSTSDNKKNIRIFFSSNVLFAYLMDIWCVFCIYITQTIYQCKASLTKTTFIPI